MRVGFDLSLLVVNPLTGVGMYALSLTRAFLQTQPGFEVRIMASNARPVYEHLNSLSPLCSRMRVVRLPTRLKLRMWTRLEWPPMDWFTGPVDIAFGAFHLLPPARRGKRAVLVYDVSWRRHAGVNTAGDVASSERLIRHAVSNADGLIAISESTKRDLIELYDAAPERIHVVHGGVDIDELNGPLDEAVLEGVLDRHHIRRPYFMYLGNLEPRKNLVRTLEAYARVCAKRSDVPQFVLTGAKAWLYEPILQAIRNFGVESHVVLTGYLPRFEALQLLKGAHAFVYTTLYEGFGLPVLEAMAAGVPVLTSNVSALPEVAGDTALLVDPGEVEAIEAGIEALLDRYDEARERAEQGRVRAARFTWERSASALAEAFQHIHGS